jgi:hypothetical protein
MKLKIPLRMHLMVADALTKLHLRRHVMLCHLPFYYAARGLLPETVASLSSSDASPDGDPLLRFKNAASCGLNAVPSNSSMTISRHEGGWSRTGGGGAT